VVGCCNLIGASLKHRLGIDYILGPELEVQGGLCTGNIVGPWAEDPDGCALDSVRLIAERERLPHENVIIVTAEDEVVRTNTSAARRIVHFKADSGTDLRQVLLLLGLQFSEVCALCKCEPDGAPTGYSPGMEYSAVVRIDGGKDQPGILSALFQNLALLSERSVQPLEMTVMDQANLMGMTNINIGVAYGPPKDPTVWIGADQPVKELVFAAKNLGFEANFEVQKFAPPSRQANIANVYVTVLQLPQLSMEAMVAVFGCIRELGGSMTSIRRLSHRALSALRLRIALDNGAVDTLRARLLSLTTLGIDVALTPSGVNHLSRRVIVFDMDSTLIQQEVIDELGRIANVEEAVKKVTEAAMRGEIDFKQSLVQRVGCLRGHRAEHMYTEVKKCITFTPGAEELCATLKARGYKMAVISGGFLPLARFVQERLQLDYAFANNLEVDENGMLTGQTVGPIVTPQRKRTLLQMIADVEGCTVEQVIAVGDGANDIPMLQQAGLGVAFCAKPKVQQMAKHRINQKDLRTIAYLLGLHDRVIEKAAAEKAGIRSVESSPRLGPGPRAAA